MGDGWAAGGGGGCACGGCGWGLGRGAVAVGACAGVGELSDAEGGLFGNPDVGRPGEGTVVLGRPIKFGLGDVKAERNGDREITCHSGVLRLVLKMFHLCHWHRV